MALHIGDQFNPYKMFVGSFIPAWLESRREITSSAKLVYARLARYAGENGRAFPRQETLADELGLSVSMVRSALRELREFNLVRSHQRGLNQSNEYSFLVHIWMELDCHPGINPDCHPSVNPGCHPSVTLRESSKENQSKIEVHASRPLLRADREEIDPLYAGVNKRVI